MTRRLTIIWFGLLLAVMAGASIGAESAGIVDDIPVGSPLIRYADPEFDSEFNLFTFRDAWLSGHAWVGGLNPATGELIPGSGLGLQIGDQLAPINELTDNGPEWLRDGGLPGVIFTRIEEGVERMYTWTAGGGQAIPVMAGTDEISRTHFAGTKHPSGRARILYRRRTAPGEPWEVHWLDLADPSVEHALPGVELEVSLPTWIGGSNILFSRLVGDTMQLFRYDTGQHAEFQLTSDSGDKLGAYAWHGPEIGGRLFVLAALRAPGDVYPRQLRLYFMNRWGVLVPYSTLNVPEEAGSHINVSSPEPFVFQGHSYVSLSLFTDDRTDASIWVFGVPEPGSATPPVPHRVDDPSIQAMKLDPEAYVTGENAYVYYYYSEPGAEGHSLLRRCAFVPVVDA